MQVNGCRRQKGRDLLQRPTRRSRCNQRCHVALPCHPLLPVRARQRGPDRRPSTGGAVNPVGALGPELVSGTFTAFWVYLLAPTLGGIAAAVLYDRVIGRGNAPAPEEEQQD